MPIDWKGVYAAATTEFHPDESLDVAATKRHFERLIEGGIHGLVVMGTVGEGTSLDPDEKREVLRVGIGPRGAACRWSRAWRNTRPAAPAAGRPKPRSSAPTG